MKRSNLWTFVAISAVSVLGATAVADPPRKPVDLDPAEDQGSAPDQAGDQQADQQGDQNADAQEAPPAGGETAPITPGKPPPKGAEPKPSVPPGEDYTVKTGDTLWDISGTYLQSPWFWPKLWSYNPQIANPHWIYPGNEIHFYPGGGAQVGEQPAPASQPAAQSGEDENEGDVTLTGRIGYVPPGTLLVQAEAFITPGELRETGKVVGSPEEKELLSFHDSVYMDFQSAKPRPGDQLVVFRTLQEIHHPVTGDLIGYLTQLRGTVRVTADGRPMVTATIDKSFQTIERGDRVGPWGEKYLRNVTPRENEFTVAGFVVATFTPEVLNIGQDHYVFVDWGRKDGVQEGNTFDVLEKRDGITEDFTARWMDGFPVETIGKLVIVDAKETASEALVVNSVRELQPGDHIQMLANQK